MPKKKKSHKNLTEQQLKDLEAAFGLFDKNGDGAIEKEEIQQVLENMGICPSEADLADMMSHVDLDGNGTISFDEFVELMKHRMGGMMKSTSDLGDEEMRQIFKMFDLDGNGYISPEELKDVMHKLGEKISDDELMIMMSKADKDGDGQINFK